MEYFIFATTVCFVGIAIGYWIGWTRREAKFQDGSIQYVIGGQPSVWIKNKDCPRTIIEVQNKKLKEKNLGTVRIEVKKLLASLYCALNCANTNEETCEIMDLLELKDSAMPQWRKYAGGKQDIFTAAKKDIKRIIKSL